MLQRVAPHLLDLGLVEAHLGLSVDERANVGVGVRHRLAPQATVIDEQAAALCVGVGAQPLAVEHDVHCAGTAQSPRIAWLI